MTDPLPVAQLRFVLRDLPADTPPDSRFFLQTNLEHYVPNRPDLEFTRADGLYSLTRHYPLGSLLAYKITRGSAQTEEGDRWGQRPPDRRLVVSGDADVPLSVQSWQDLHRQERPSTLSGYVDSVKVYSPQLGEETELLVYLPPGAANAGSARRAGRDPSRRYPVMYLHDGQNVFDAATSFAGQEWEADEAAEHLAREGLEAILVALPASELHRRRDYTPFKSRLNGYAPGAENQLAFLTETAMPLINARYPTRSDPAGTAIAGSSLGGLISLYGGLSRPRSFGFIAALSPSLWLSDHEIFGWTAGLGGLSSRVYLDMGELEGDSQAEANFHIAQARRYAAQLSDQGAEVRFVMGQGHWHDEPSWAARFPAALRWFIEGSQEPV